MVQTPGVEPGPAAYQTAMQTAYTRPGRKMEVPTPQGSSPCPGIQSRVPRRRHIFQSGRRGTRTPRAARATLRRFERRSSSSRVPSMSGESEVRTPERLITAYTLSGRAPRAIRTLSVDHTGIEPVFAR